MLAGYNISSLALLSFIPTGGTGMAKSPVVSDDHFLEIVEHAVDRLSARSTWAA